MISEAEEKLSVEAEKLMNYLDKIVKLSKADIDSAKSLHAQFCDSEVLPDNTFIFICSKDVWKALKMDDSGEVTL